MGHCGCHLDLRSASDARVWYLHPTIRWNESLSRTVILANTSHDLHLSLLLYIFTYIPYSSRVHLTSASIYSDSATETSASNAITASSYLLKAAGVDSTTWKLRGLSIGAVAFAVSVHTVAPRIGRGLQDILSGVKLFVLFFIICTGFAALGGHLRVPKPNNLEISNSFKGTSNSGYGIGTALLDAMFSYQGYDNLNAVCPTISFLFEGTRDS